MIDTIVTGASGWLGSRLVHALQHGLPDVLALATPDPRRLRVLVHKKDAARDVQRLVQSGVEVVSGDLRDPRCLEELFSGMQNATLFHTASVIHPGKTVAAFQSVNVNGTRALIEAATGHVKRFVYVSSNSPMGVNGSPLQTFTESAPYRPYMGYGRSKMQAEALVQNAQDENLFETVVVRPPWFYGPNQPTRQSLFFKMVRTGRFPLLGDGAQRRSMVYIDNLCQGLLLAERTPGANGQTYFIADLEPYTMNDILATLREVMTSEFGAECAPKTARLPAFIGKCAELADFALQSVGLYNQKLHVLGEMDKTIAFSVKKAERELGYAPSVSLREGMRRSLKWMNDAGQPW